MSHCHFRFPFKALAVVLSVACFLAFGQGAVSSALGADADTFEAWPKKPGEPGANPPPPKAAANETGTFETWPKKPAEPGVEPAAKAGEVAGAKTAEGISAGTWGWIAAGVAALLVIGWTAAGGGGGSSTTSNH